MSSVKRWLLNLLAAVSLVSCVATAGLWVRTYVAQDQLSWRGGRYFVMAETYAGVVEVSLSSAMTFTHAPDGWQYFRSPYENRYEHLAVHRQRPAPGNGGWDRWLIVLPLWLPMLISAAPLAAGWRLRKRRGRTGTCVQCGYDLRATPDRCPECGTAVNATSPT
jgi:hypothetical protein